MNTSAVLLKKASKFLSYVLRHAPEAIGLKMDERGWASVEHLLTCANASGRRLSRELLLDVVRTNDKQRFALSEDGLSIRASQGHSVAVNLDLKAQLPPDTLFHGTARRSVTSILQDGLQPMNRQHVHLSLDYETAVKVGQRHGKPVVLKIDAKAMHEQGHVFFLSDNGVWLTEVVPVEYLVLSTDEEK
jgi:putative RNA 2'-phosphotransferase